MSWQEQAKLLPTGGKMKIVCCGNSPSALISNNRKGIRYHCFRCTDYNTFEPHGERSVSEILRARNEIQELKKSRDIPDRCIPLNSPDVPLAAHVWVLRGGLTPEDAYNLYGMKYDPFLRRVIIPLRKGFLSRALYDERPKYIKSSLTETYELYRDNSAVVVTEDILSAIKVHKAGYNSIAILGTAVSITMAHNIAQYKEAVIWTDDDKAGKDAYVKLKKRLALYPIKVRRILTTDDPKRINLETIKQLMEKRNETND